MKLAIMQPYFMPYLGYWQLINAVDKFVVLDNVNFIKQGYINRNSILMGGKAHPVNIQVASVSSNKLIKEHQLVANPIWKKKLLRSLQQSYSKAPYFTETFSLVEALISSEELSLSKYLVNQLKGISSYLGIEAEFVESATIYDTGDLMAVDRVLEICKQAEAGEYINAVGGQGLYDKGFFSDNGIRLSFIKMKDICYQQFKGDYIPNLSIIDVMMFNSVEDIKSMLNEYKLV